MQILSSEDRLDSSYITPFIDTSKHLIINTVPYDKVTKTPMPFRNVISKGDKYVLYGKKSFHPYQEKNLYDSNNTPTKLYSEYYKTAYSNYNSHECIVDCNDSNITYVIEIANDVYSSSDMRTAYIRKITSTNDGINMVQSSNIPSLYTNNLCCYLTQDENYIYALIDGYYSTISSWYGSKNTPRIYKINKNTLTSSTCYLSGTMYNGQSYVNGDNPTFTYNSSYTKVLQETEDGLILYSETIFNGSYTSGSPTNSNNYSYQYLEQEYRFYSFETNRLTRISYTLDSNCPTPPYYSSVFNSSYSSFGSSSVGYNKMCLPSKCLETETKYYFYLYSHSCSSLSSSSAPSTLYLFEQDKSDVLTSKIYKVNLVFPEGSDISSVPTSNAGSASSYGLNGMNLARHETQAFNIDGVDYVNIWWEGIFNAPTNDRGVYTFKVNQAKTEATYLGSYKAVGGALHGYMPLNNDETKILISTPTSYHIAIFDAEAEEWKITYESMTTLKSIVQTDDDKIYALTNSNELICQDLEGATTIDFTFEQTSYQYNDTDITTYIQLWSKNSEDEYVETTVKLTLQGNAVWQSNGLQTLTVTTSDEGKINVPFVIKGQSTINVSVDVVL